MAAAEPTRIRTFLFTDIESSARLWERDAERMSAALAHHDELCKEVVQANRGVVIKMVGDGMYAVFDDPLGAVSAILDLEIALADPAATDGIVLRVRCGLHSGIAERRDADFHGSAVNRTARITSAAHGGQVLLSQATVDLVQDRLPAKASLRDLGVVRLRDLASPERVFQLVHPSLRQDFPALRSLDATPNNLPLQASSFVGRQAELAVAKRLLSATRLLTIVGVGGIGKTRCSLQIAAAVLDTYPDGAWFVELASVTDPALVPAAVAQVLGVRDEGTLPLARTLGAHLESRRLLLVLDNCEHLVDACAALASALLGTAPELCILASSREPLNIAGEQAYSLPPLALPDATDNAESSGHAEAVQLFVERARLKQPAFTLDEGNVHAVASICARLDGIPLALELAAARIGGLPVEAIAERLNDRFRLLTGGHRSALPRQQTLHALITWSYDLLTEPEKLLFRRLAVFAGGWTHDAVETVGAGDGIDSVDVLDLVTDLVQKSLVMRDETSHRYRMLETIRQYAQERLGACGEEALIAQRHCAYFAALAEEAEPSLEGSPEQPRWLARLDLEHDNLRAALEWSLCAPGPHDTDLRLCGALGRYWAHRGHAREGREWCARALARPTESSVTTARSKGLHACGLLTWRLGEVAAAQAVYEQALGLSRELGDRAHEGRALSNLGGIAIHRGDAASAKSRLEQAVTINRELGNRTLELRNLNNLAALAISEGNETAAEAYLERALDLSSEAGNRMEEATIHSHLGVLAQHRGDLTAAQAWHERALATAREFGVREFEIEEERHLAEVALAKGDVKLAASRLQPALVASQELASQHEVAQCLDVVATLAIQERMYLWAAELLGAADALFEALATPRMHPDRVRYDAMVSECREALGEAARQTASAAGRAMPSSVAVSGARAWLEGR